MPGVGGGKGDLVGGITKGPEQPFGVMDTFIIWRVVVVSGVCTHVKAH